ncbi:MAG: M28 family peptidase [Paludibacter sp.]|jgi:hypothetical protein|nr:M28 family peptidase [Paludibacter sp.]
MKLLITIISPLFAVLLFACNQKTTQSSDSQSATVTYMPAFNPDSAYRFIQNQVDFGARVPNTEAHRRCAEYLSAELKRFGAEVTEQRADLKAYDGAILKAVNIIGSFNVENKQRILLFAHWDSRHISDHDAVPANRSQAVMGANDGASGVGVLLEIARRIGAENPETGVDIAFFDAEDYGAPADFTGREKDSWCLGSQYWSKHPHTPDYKARFGILLDMVAAPDATFFKEYYSMNYAAHVVKKVWSAALDLGFGQYFKEGDGGGIMDDHYYVNRLADIPSIDIIHTLSDGNFGHYWHTTHDTMENIDRNTLFAVGTTLMYVIYNEKSF